MGGLLTVKLTVLWIAVVILAVAGLVPLLTMFLQSVVVDGQFNLSFYAQVVTSSRQWSLLGNSLILASLTTLGTTLVGLPLGILLGKSDLPLRRTFIFLFTIPLLIPPYVTAVSWFDVLGRNGLLSKSYPALAATTSSWLFGLPGCVLVLSSTFLPVVMILTITFLKTVNPHLEEAARLSSNWFGVMMGVTVPLVRSGVFLAALLVFLLSLGEFGVPMFLRYNVFPVEAFTQFSAFFDYGAATAAAVPLALITCLVLLLEANFLREKTCQLRPASGAALQIRLGRLRNIVFLAVSLFCIVLVLLPLSALLVQSASQAAYMEAIWRAGDSLLRSLLYAAIGASLVVLLGFATGYLIHSRALGIYRSVDTLTVVLFAMPSTVIGIGLISLWNQPSTTFIYATPAIILLGYIAQYTALSSRITVSTLSQIPVSMEEAAEISGAGWLRQMALIIAPLAKRGLAGAWLVCYIFCLRDTGITMMVYPPGRDTLPVRIFSLMANGPPDLIAALCIILILCTLLPLSLLAVVIRLKRQES